MSSVGWNDSLASAGSISAASVTDFGAATASAMAGATEIEVADNQTADGAASIHRKGRAASQGALSQTDSWHTARSSPGSQHSWHTARSGLSQDSWHSARSRFSETGHRQARDAEQRLVNGHWLPVVLKSLQTRWRNNTWKRGEKLLGLLILQAEAQRLALNPALSDIQRARLAAHAQAHRRA